MHVCTPTALELFKRVFSEVDVTESTYLVASIMVYSTVVQLLQRSGAQEVPSLSMDIGRTILAASLGSNPSADIGSIPVCFVTTDFDSDRVLLQHQIKAL